MSRSTKGNGYTTANGYKQSVLEKLVPQFTPIRTTDTIQSLIVRPFPSPSGQAELAVIDPERIETPAYNLAKRTEKTTRLGLSISLVGLLELPTVKRIKRREGWFRCVGGNRRLKELGKEWDGVPCLVRDDIREQTGFVEIDRHRMRHTKNDYLERFFFRGHPAPTNDVREIENAQELIGEETIEWLKDHGGSMYHFEFACKAAEYCRYGGRQGNGKRLFLVQLLKWMVAKRQVPKVRFVTENGLDAAFILEAMSEGEKIHFTKSHFAINVAVPK